MDILKNLGIKKTNRGTSIFDSYGDQEIAYSISENGGKLGAGNQAKGTVGQ